MLSAINKDQKESVYKSCNRQHTATSIQTKSLLARTDNFNKKYNVACTTPTCFSGRFLRIMFLALLLLYLT